MQKSELILQALKEKAERENPKPLTLEQLKKNVGRPIYVVFTDGAKTDRWGILFQSKQLLYVLFPIGIVYPKTEDNIECYLHEPKEVNNG